MFYIGSTIATYDTCLGFSESNRELVLILVGEISERNLPDLRSAVAAEPKTTGIVLDLRDLTLVDQEAIEFPGGMRKQRYQTPELPNLQLGTG